MATYPEEIFEQREMENLPGISFDASKKQNLYAEDMQNLANEIIAIQTILGTNPQGAFATVKEWLQDLAGVSPSFSSSISPSESPSFSSSISPSESPSFSSSISPSVSPSSSISPSAPATVDNPNGFDCPNYAFYVGMWGYKIQAKNNTNIVEVELDPNAGYSWVAIFDENFDLIENSQASNFVCSFSNVAITTNSYYYLLAHVNSGDYYARYYSGGNTYPVNCTDLDYICFAYSGTYTLTPTITTNNDQAEGITNIVTG